MQLSEILAAELLAIAGNGPVGEAVGNNQTLEQAMAAADATARGRQPPPSEPDKAAEHARRRVLYRVAHGLGLNALCLSGGGIRSAAISLGVIQALVDKGVLRNFHYLSTVSGGGYIGAWLSAWLHRAGSAAAVLSRLGSARSRPDEETPPLAHLREYSNYLTPKIGLFSADTWTALAIVLRNIVVNWLILLPVLALVVIGVKLIALGLTWPAAPPGASWTGLGRFFTGLLAAGCLVSGAMAFGYKLARLYIPPRSEMPEAILNSKAATEQPDEAQARFLWASLLPATLAGFFFVWLALQGRTPAIGLLQAIFGQESAAGIDLYGAVLLFAVGVYILALIVARLWRRHLGVSPPIAGLGLEWRDFACWLAAVSVFALLVWLGARAIDAMPLRIVLHGQICGPGSAACTANQDPTVIMRDSLVAVFGMPWYLMATMLAHSVYLLFRSHSRKGEVEREWLGRGSGWHFIAGLAWIMLSAIVLLGPALYYYLPQAVNVVTVVSGTVTGILGKSGLTPATGKAVDWKGWGANLALAIAGPVFAALLLILLSVVVDWSVIGWNRQCFPTDGAWDCHSARWLWPIAVAALVLVLANYFANINAFSLHAVYRNRLIRGFIGGARAPHRHPEGFTDFDWDDDLRVADLWRPPPAQDDWRPFHVINMTLNLAATKRLAWQERKAMPFSVTPFACGNAELGYRATRDYGGPPVPDGPNGEIRSGISLGTAMAISGAAVSSSMGYHSSMSLSFLLTFFNVRLGVWLANPGPPGGRLNRFQSLIKLRAPHHTSGPQFAVRPLVSELFGLTDDDSPYVYLSDGGHFEDLGLYEMVRRRCRRIIVVDGDQDPDRGFEDLGNAVRKIWIDLGVHITFEGAPLLAADKDAKLGEVPYFAIGTITYLSDPKIGQPPQAPEGKIIYIKPVVRGDEAAADVVAYKRAHPDFPAQSTAEQWFDESQFESYRRLGQLMTERLFKATEVAKVPPADLATLFDRLKDVDQAKMGQRQPPAPPLDC